MYDKIYPYYSNSIKYINKIVNKNDECIRFKI
ncbi:hypothetical protein BTW14_gp184 [BeAn 58058 virus]|nr:hypothetical protein BTW14_gp184 [BeAn 58058 virus]APG58375.1 hypothetical protein BAV00199 [BeAn 58058 virus]